MAHFAEIDETNIVTRVLVVNDADAADGQNFLANTLDLGGTWIQTSYNTSGGVHANGGTPVRKNYAGIGYSYDSVRDAFIPPKPFASLGTKRRHMSLDAPTPMPVEEGKFFRWVEEDLNWQEVVLGE